MSETLVNSAPDTEAALDIRSRELGAGSLWLSLGSMVVIFVGGTVAGLASNGLFFPQSLAPIVALSALAVWVGMLAVSVMLGAMAVRSKRAGKYQGLAGLLVSSFLLAFLFIAVLASVTMPLWAREP